MPSSLTRVLPRTLGFSPRIPVSVYGTGGYNLTRSFSRQCGVNNFACISTRYTSRLRFFGTRICLCTILHAYTQSSSLALAYPPVSLHRSNNYHRYWNINQLSISYALCLGLGPDLPWDDDRCPGILMLSVERILTFLFATHTNILTSHKSTEPYSSTSTLWERSPTPCTLYIATASVSYLSPGNLRRRVSRPVSYYALFKWWLLLSQHPGCL